MESQGFGPVAPIAHSYGLRSTRPQDDASTTEAQRTTAAQESEPVPPRSIWRMGLGGVGGVKHSVPRQL